MPQSRVTIKDIAHAAGVSSATVSMALNDKGSLTEARRQEIKRLAAEMGYAPSSIAQALRGMPTKIVGVICSDFSNPMFRDVFSGLGESLNKHDYDFLTMQSLYSAEKEDHLIQKMTRQGVDALIIEPCAPLNPLLHTVARTMPVVQIIQSMSPQLPSICSDNRHGAELATRHLLSLDDRPIVHIGGDQRFTAFQERQKGFCEALRALRPQTCPDDVILSLRGLHYEEGLMIAPRLFKQFPPPVSLFVVNDMVALGIVNYCRKAGLRIPEDVRVAGFCNVEQLEIYGSPLTSVEFSKRAMGKLAGDMVLGALLSHETIVPTIIDLPVSLVVRASTVGYTPTESRA